MEFFTFLFNINRLIKETPIFETEARPRECLPKNFPAEIEGTCHFLNGYRHPDYQPEKDDTSGESLQRRSIRYAVKLLRIGSFPASWKNAPTGPGFALSSEPARRAANFRSFSPLLSLLVGALFVVWNFLTDEWKQYVKEETLW